MAEAHITGMNSGEYTRVFGGDATPILSDEVIIDIGSGVSDLSNLVPGGAVFQVDPVYSELSTDGHRTIVPGRLGTNSTDVASLVRELEKVNADRVTIANSLRYLSVAERTLAVAQLLQLSHQGIAQIYPVSNNKAETIAAGAEQLGFTTIVQRASLGGLRQIAYKMSRINNVISIVGQPKRVGPSDRLKVAKRIVNGLS